MAWAYEQVGSFSYTGLVIGVAQTLKVQVKHHLLKHRKTLLLQSLLSLPSYVAEALSGQLPPALAVRQK